IHALGELGHLGLQGVVGAGEFFRRARKQRERLRELRGIEALPGIRFRHGEVRGLFHGWQSTCRVTYGNRQTGGKKCRLSMLRACLAAATMPPSVKATCEGIRKW